MPRKAYWDQRREKFAIALASGMPVGEAGASVGYSAHNASRNAGRADVKARVAELLAPAKARVAEKIEANLEWATRQCIAVVEKALPGEPKVSDGLAALKLAAELNSWIPAENAKAQPTTIKFQLNIFGADQQDRVIEHESLNGSGNH